jgi:hypothetical protein
MFLRNEDLRKLGIGVLQDLQDFFSEEGGTGEGPGGGTLNLIVVNLMGYHLLFTDFS